MTTLARLDRLEPPLTHPQPSPIDTYLLAQLELELAELQVALLRDTGLSSTDILGYTQPHPLADYRYECGQQERYGMAVSAARVKAQMRRLVTN
jgi:hypothetical protein